MQGDYRHILKYIGVFGGVQGLTLLLGVVKNKLVAVLIGPAGVGLLSLFNSIVRLVSDTTGLGISVSGTRMIAGCLSEDERRDAVRLVRQYALVAAGGGLVVTASLAYPLSRWLFGDGEHMLGLLLIAPVVALTILAGGELCVLKGLGRLRQLALVSALSIVVVLLLTIPLYLLLGIDAIVPSLLVAAVVNYGMVVACSARAVPLDWSVELSCLWKNRRLLRIGMAFVVASVFGSGVDLLVRYYINSAGGASVLGIYNAGYMMCMSYAGAFFASMETDYYPRLSRVDKLGDRLNEVVNRQIEATTLMVSPLLLLFILGSPILIPLLYSGKFAAAIPMVRWGMLAMYIRCLTLAIEYIALSRNKTGSYVLTEAVSYGAQLASLIVGYAAGGVQGAGVGMLVAGGVELIFVLFYGKVYYKYQLKGRTCLVFITSFTLATAAVWVSTCADGLWLWLLGGGVLLVNVAYSIVAFTLLVAREKEDSRQREE